MSDVRETQLLVIGGGPGGYPAALHAADHGIKVTLVDEGAKLGGVCLNRGCIPSKALLHTAKIIREAHEMANYGVTFGEPTLDLAKLRDFVQAKVVSKLTGGIGQLTKGRGVDVVKGRAVFTSPNTVEVTGDAPQTIKFQNCIIATGSLPVVPKPWQINDDRVMDSTGALLLPDVPKRFLVIGGGYIGLEIGSVYAALGSKVTVVEALDRILFMADKDLVDPLEKKLKSEFEAIYTATKVMGLEATKDGIVVKLEGAGAPASLTFDRVLISVGRRPNSAGLGLDKAGVNVTEKGFIPIDKQRRTNVPHIFAIGDVGEEPGLAHKATAEARVVVEVIHGEPAEWNPRAIPAVIFTDPEIAWAGITQKEADEKKIPYEALNFPWAASGRAVSIARTEGRTKMLVDPETKRILGVGIVGAGAGEMIAESVLAIEMGAVARDVLESIHPHPTLSETVMESAELAYGAATHVGRPRKVAR
ncbi:Dihydrolipoyl dehydrogenase [Gemmata sp. SH-PL17]|uniref:dihydrolipoyl dehydrogenase n=1 Tax=Gemmata sp. SH-PL17 TaxID=1630693 RepID=UPI00078D7266|nr:dihydrolipoyl dehydrogenase [Gemmata sp. SH-PL17]AMV28532.1 Dihydrolipoyl dehydrogenase [Gemmata sp. SH-PL17]